MGRTVSLLDENLAFGTIHPGNERTEVTGPRTRADGWFGWSDGLHTVSFQVSHRFNGRIYLEGSLASDPDDNDWFPILIGNNTEPFITFPGNPPGPRNTDAMQVRAATFIGNFAWIRFRVSHATQGSVGKILMNH